MRADVLQRYPASTRPGSTSSTTASTPSEYAPDRGPDVLRPARHRPRPAQRGLRRADHPAEGPAVPAARGPRAAAGGAARAAAPARRTPPRSRPRSRRWSPSCGETATGVVWIPEMLPKPEVIQVLTHATVFVCPSVYEPMGIVNLEAMACETAVVATATGGIPEVVADGETGWLVPIEQVDDGSGTPLDPDRFVADLAAAITEAAGRPGAGRGVRPGRPGAGGRALLLGRRSPTGRWRSTARSWPDRLREPGAAAAARRHAVTGAGRSGVLAAWPLPAMLSAPTVAAVATARSALASSDGEQHPAALVGGAGDGRESSCSPSSVPRLTTKAVDMTRRARGGRPSGSPHPAALTTLSAIARAGLPDHGRASRASIVGSARPAPDGSAGPARSATAPPARGRARVGVVRRPGRPGALVALRAAGLHRRAPGRRRCSARRRTRRPRWPRRSRSAEPRGMPAEVAGARQRHEDDPLAEVTSQRPAGRRHRPRGRRRAARGSSASSSGQAAGVRRGGPQGEAHRGWKAGHGPIVGVATDRRTVVA